MTRGKLATIIIYIAAVWFAVYSIYTIDFEKPPTLVGVLGTADAVGIVFVSLYVGVNWIYKNWNTPLNKRK
jgi:hypothetical protein